MQLMAVVVHVNRNQVGGINRQEVNLTVVLSVNTLSGSIGTRIGIGFERTRFKNQFIIRRDLLHLYLLVFNQLLLNKVSSQTAGMADTSYLKDKSKKANDEVSIKLERVGVDECQNIRGLRNVMVNPRRIHQVKRHENESEQSEDNKQCNRH